MLSCASAGDSIFNMCCESLILLLSTVSHRQYVQRLRMVCSSFNWSICVPKNRVSSKLFNIWTRNKNNSPSDDVLEWQIVPQCFVVLFEISIWKAFLVMVCSPVKLSSSASLRNRVVIPGFFFKFENFPNAEWVWDFHFFFQVHFIILSCTYPRMIYWSAILC